MNKPNYQQMTRQDLKEYVLAHRDDLEALQELFSRPSENTIYFQNETPIEEAEAIIQQHKQKKWDKA
jgi:superfamily II DNA or RNA helicase